MQATTRGSGTRDGVSEAEWFDKGTYDVAKLKNDQPPEELLWDAATKLRTNMDAATYKHPVLGLIFLKYISDSFDQQREKLEGQYGDPGSDDYIDNPQVLAEVLEDRDEYRADNVFWVPDGARWSDIEVAASTETIAKVIDDALREIERENPALKGTLGALNFQGLPLRANVLGELVQLIGGVGFADTAGEHSRDLLGRVYEYCIKNFAKEEGQNAGAFYTPQAVTRLLVEMLEPYSGRVFDPACGSCGLFVQSAKFLEHHHRSASSIAVSGQENTMTTERIGRMNLAIHGLSGEIKGGDSLLNDQFPTLRADYVLANPPFNHKDWGAARVANDARWKYGLPPESNANYAWIQHFVHHLAPNGRAGFVLSNGSLTSNQSGEGEIRRKLIEADIVDCVVALPAKLFYSTQIPACLWFVDMNKKGTNGARDRRGETLFIDAREHGTMITRTQREFTDADVANITGAYHAWRGQPEAGDYNDMPGFCASVSVANIRKGMWSLAPGRYVGAPADTESSQEFEERMARFIASLSEELAKNKRLAAEVETMLEVLSRDG